MQGWVTQCFLHDENHLEVSPLNSIERVAHPKQEAVTVGVSLFSFEKGALVYAVNHTVFRGFEPCSEDERGEQVGDVNDLIALLTCGHVTWVAHQRGSAEGTFHAGEIGAVEVSGRATPR